MIAGNIRIWRLLSAAMQQWRIRTVGAGDVVVSQLHGLDMAALSAMAPAFGVAQDRLFFEKLRIFERACISLWSGEKTCTAQQKANCKFRFEEHLAWACDNCPENPKKA